MTSAFRLSGLKAVIAAASMISIAAPSLAQSVPNWMPVQGINSPGYGGLVRFSQSTPDGALWIMTEGGGTHISMNGGANWNASNNGLGNMRIKAGVIDSSTSPYKAFAGTYGGGVFKTADGGSSWFPINGGLGCNYITALQGLGTRLLAGTDCQSSSGVYFADVGMNWALASGLPSNVRINSINRINSTPFAVDYLLANTNNGIYRSNDSGSTWVSLPTSPSGMNGANVYNVRALFYNTNVVRLIATVEAGGVFVSENGGTTWTASNTGLPNNPIPMAGMRWDANTSTLYLSLDGQGTYKSNDRGATWALAFGPDALPAARGVSPASASMLLADTLAGPYKSTDGGVNWVKTGAGLPGGWTNNLRMDNATPANIYASAADGVYKFDGTQWSKMPSLPSMVHGHVKVRGATVYATTTNAGIYKFNATSGAWQAINTGLPSNLVGRNPKYVGDGVNANNAYLGLYGDGVYFTNDAGATWTARNVGLTGAALNVNSMDVYGPLIYISTDAGIYKSTNDGLNWTLVFEPKNALNQTLPSGAISVDPLVNSTVYAGVFNTDTLGNSLASNGVYKSTDAGATWTQLSGMAGKPVRDVRFIGANNTLVASVWDESANGGIFTSNDAGATWQAANNGLTSHLVNSVMGTPNGAYAATRGAGLFSFVDTSSIFNEWKYFGVWTNGTSTNYNVSYGAKDVNQTLTSIAVSGGGLTATASYWPTDQSWHADMQFGANTPPLSNVYSATVTPKTGSPSTKTFSIRATGFLTAFPTNIQPSGGANVSTAVPVFSWTPPAGNVNYTYGVNLQSLPGYTQVWSTSSISGTSISYAGPPLVPGTQYQINVQSNEWDSINNATYGATRAETFCFQCTGGTTGVNFDQLFIGRNAGIGNENFGVSVRYPRTANDGLASYSVQCPNGVSASGQFGTSTSSGTNYEWYNVNLGTTQPATPFNCSSTVTTTGGSSNTTSLTVDRFADAAAYPNSISLVANADVSSFTTVSFTNPIAGTPNTRVQSNLWAVNANGSLGQQLWFVGDTTSPMTYNGPALTPNTKYQLAITTVDGTNTMHAAQQWIPFCYQCGGTGGTGGSGTGVNLVSGWNLIGNSDTTALDVATAFGDKTKVTTVWKWIPSSSKWAFYAPSMTSAALATYAAGKGYDVLTTVNGGEGVWVNAAVSFTATLPTGNAVTTSSFATTLGSGWSLISIGDNKTPRAFNNALSITPPSAGVVAASVLTTVWAWDSSRTSWYFYAPSLDNTNTLASYALSKGYLDFGSNTLAPGVGFWVNKP